MQQRSNIYITYTFRVQLSFEKYVSVLARCKHIGVLMYIGSKEVDILREFLLRPIMSTYMINSMLQTGKISGKPMAYKNTRMHVKKLLYVGFIEPAKWKNTKHGAVYYRISEAGMFDAIRLPIISEAHDLTSILDNHGNYLIFETLLYPCFKKETLKAIRWNKDSLVYSHEHILKRRATRFLAFEIENAIREYLRDCCQEIYSIIKRDDFRLPAGGKPPKVHLDELDYRIPPLKDTLIMKILLLLGRPNIRKVIQHRDQTDIISVLAADGKFMTIAQDLQKDINKIFDFVKQLRDGS
jgi:hypothetical protein